MRVQLLEREREELLARVQSLEQERERLAALVEKVGKAQA